MDNQLHQADSSLWEPSHTTSSLSQSFPFLEFPREIRDMIYYYALLRPNPRGILDPTHICVAHKTSLGSPFRRRRTVPGGGERPSRLFRVSRQVFSEAIKVFYSQFHFYFPVFNDVDTVKCILRDTLSGEARNLIRNVCFRLDLAPLLDPDENDIETVTQLLPNIRRAEVEFRWFDFMAVQHRMDEYVERALHQAGSLRGLPGLVLRGPSGNSMKGQIMSKVREVLGCKSTEAEGEQGS
ncbi:MAG: hypothetical protein Q9181_005157 [Wetmoreana brouardii]